MRPRRVERNDVLVVCTGNVCRSPYIAAQIKHAVPHLSVATAGTGALIGKEPEPAVLDLLKARSVAAPHATARSLHKGLVKGARLIITAERSHRVEVVRLSQAADDRTFTLFELARLIDGTPASDGAGDGVDGVLKRARKALSREDAVDHEDNLPDPFGGPLSGFDAMAAAVDAALGRVVPLLKRRPT